MTVFLIGIVLGFVVGVLFGRRNPRKVDKVVSRVKTVNRK